jgi:KUP system potassium uptake protein
MALGVVYGDIGTSPLYALRICFSERSSVPPTPENVLGVLSLIIWSLILMVSVKYLLFVLRADNRGEGGILALMNLTRKSPISGRSSAIIVGLGLFGAALLCGDSLITPVISVLSAVEGITVAAPAWQGIVLPAATGILIFLFLFQRRGTADIGSVFGVVMIVWFLVLAVLGILSLRETPRVLESFNPIWAVRFAAANGVRAFLTLGGVFLVLTGAEAIYADIGHLGKGPIRIGWYGFVLPSLLLNYLGQGALLIRDPASLSSLFFRLAPGWAAIPLTVLSAVATVIASQAVISGAFSLARQAVQLSYVPRMEIVHTSARMIGQVYVPVMNGLLLVGSVILVLAFKKSDNLAGAYGVAVSCTMLITTVLMLVLALRRWKWPAIPVIVLSAVFLTIDLSFFGANMMKIFHGGYVSLLLAGAVVLLVAAWRKGRSFVGQRLEAEAFPEDLFVRDIRKRRSGRVPGIGVFLTGNPLGIPRTLLHNYRFNRTLHETILLLTVKTEEEPEIYGGERLILRKLGGGLYRAEVRFGYMERHDIPEALKPLRIDGKTVEPLAMTYYLGKETLVPARGSMFPVFWRGLFMFLVRNARDASAYFCLPVNRVVELGIQMEV